MNKIKVRRLNITGLRGIRRKVKFDFTKQFESVIVYGANAKGKSSIGDAFEWFFKGSIAELTKEGCTRDDYRHRLLDAKEDTIVEFEFSKPVLSSNQTLKASRRQKQSNVSEEFKEYIRVSSDELLILRHKDLKKFVDKSKGDKRKQISQLIGMEGWEKIRDDMGTVNNVLEKELENTQKRIYERRSEVVDFMDTDKFSEAACWDFAEKQAKILGIKRKIGSIENLKETDDKAKAKATSTDRTAILARLNGAEEIFKNIEEKPPSLYSLNRFSNLYNNLCAQPEKILWLKLNELYKHGKSILQDDQWEEDSCPLCGIKIEREELIKHIQVHQDKNKEIQDEIDQLEKARSNANRELKSLSNLLISINELDLNEKVDLKQIKKVGAGLAIALASGKALLEKILKSKEFIVLDDLELDQKLLNLVNEGKNVKVGVEQVQKDLTPTKAETSRIEAFQKISNLASHMTALDVMNSEMNPLMVQVDSMKAFTEDFQRLRRDTMGVVLKEISEDVSRYFIQLHPKEGFDDIRLKFLPKEDGVEFHIYYKGEEISPPRRFLSESYLNGLGVCLFLATVRAFNIKNGFVVLDDIINSFDAEHRADLACLLVNEFSDYQLLVLTHDEIWFDLFRRLTQKGWQHKRIKGWSYEEGVDIKGTTKDEFGDCEEAIASGNVKHSARMVRGYIETILKTLSFRLGVRMRFKPGSPNDGRMPSELLSEMIRHLKEKDFFNLVDEQKFRELEASNFIVNYGSHDQKPTTVGLVMGDISFAFGRIQELEKLFICPKCSKKVWNIVSKDFDMQCKCGQHNL
jgi:DNA-directed RNA polymerase subunit RPC12/RpoP